MKARRIAALIDLVAASSLVAASLLGCAHTTATDPGRANRAPVAIGAEAVIPFANHGGIRNWRALDDSTLWLEDQSGYHYQAKLVTPSWQLAYTETIGFVTDPGGNFDRHSAIAVKGMTYPLASLIRVEAPRAKIKAPAAASTASAP